MKLTATQRRMMDLIVAGAKISNYAGQPGVNLASVQSLYNKGLIGYDQATDLYTLDPSQRMH